MAVVINEFEVMPAAPDKDNQNEGKKADEKGKSEPEMSNYELKKLLTRHIERLERISAH